MSPNSELPQHPAGPSTGTDPNCWRTGIWSVLSAEGPRAAGAALRALAAGGMVKAQEKPIALAVAALCEAACFAPGGDDLLLSQAAALLGAEPETPVPSSDDREPARRRLAVRALGRLEVRIGDRLIERWSSRRALAVFRYLIVHRRAVRRDALMEALWPDGDPESSRNSLNVAIHHLRRILDAGPDTPGANESMVLHRDGTYLLNPEVDVRLDIEDFRRLMTSASARWDDGDRSEAKRVYTDAVGLRRGALFGGDVPDWCLPLARKLDDDYADALANIAAWQVENEEFGPGQQTCEHLLEIDPCRETAHQLLMKTYAATARPHLAARQFATCVEVLADQLDVVPRPETVAVYKEIVSVRK